MSPGKWKPKTWPTRKRKKCQYFTKYLSLKDLAFPKTWESSWFTVVRSEDALRVAGMRLDVDV